jgi:elongation factor P
VDILTFEGKPIAIELPIKIQREVIEAPPGVRGDTSTNVMKDATVAGGLKVKVPLFVNEGDTIILDTRDGSYVERVQNS